jgi:hypothetical protein
MKETPEHSSFAIGGNHPQHPHYGSAVIGRKDCIVARQTIDDRGEILPQDLPVMSRHRSFSLCLERLRVSLDVRFAESGALPLFDSRQQGLQRVLMSPTTPRFTG